MTHNSGCRPSADAPCSFGARCDETGMAARWRSGSTEQQVNERAFSNFADVEAWAEAHGIAQLRSAIQDGRFAAGSAFLANTWLQRFDSHLILALEQGLVVSPKSVAAH